MASPYIHKRAVRARKLDSVTVTIVIELSGDVVPPCLVQLEAFYRKSLFILQFANIKLGILPCRFTSQHIKPLSQQPTNTHCKLLDFCLWNTRSIRNKSLALKDYIHGPTVDIQKTWRPIETGQRFSMAHPKSLRPTLAVTL